MLNYIINNFKLLINKYNFEIFIGDSIGGTLILDLLNNFNYSNKKLILFSPLIKYPIQYKINNDWIDLKYFNNLFDKYYDRNNDFNLENIPNTLLIFGENEIMYNDLIDFNIKGKKIIIKNGYHIQPLIIKFSNNILQFILDFINK